MRRPARSATSTSSSHSGPGVRPLGYPHAALYVADDWPGSSPAEQASAYAEANLHDSGAPTLYALTEAARRADFKAHRLATVRADWARAERLYAAQRGVRYEDPPPPF